MITLMKVSWPAGRKDDGQQQGSRATGGSRATVSSGATDVRAGRRAGSKATLSPWVRSGWLDVL